MNTFDEDEEEEINNEVEDDYNEEGTPDDDDGTPDDDDGTPDEDEDEVEVEDEVEDVKYTKKADIKVEDDKEDKNDTRVIIKNMIMKAIVEKYNSLTKTLIREPMTVYDAVTIVYEYGKGRKPTEADIGILVTKYGDDMMPVEDVKTLYDQFGVELASAKELNNFIHKLNTTRACLKRMIQVLYRSRIDHLFDMKLNIRPRDTVKKHYGSDDSDSEDEFPYTYVRGDEVKKLSRETAQLAHYHDKTYSEEFTPHQIKMKNAYVEQLAKEGKVPRDWSMSHEDVIRNINNRLDGVERVSLPKLINPNTNPYRTRMIAVKKTQSFYQNPDDKHYNPPNIPYAINRRKIEAVKEVTGELKPSHLRRFQESQVYDKATPKMVAVKRIVKKVTYPVLSTNRPNLVEKLHSETIKVPTPLDYATMIEAMLR